MASLVRLLPSPICKRCKCALHFLNIWMLISGSAALGSREDRHHILQIQDQRTQRANSLQYGGETTQGRLHGKKHFETQRTAAITIYQPPTYNLHYLIISSYNPPPPETTLLHSFTFALTVMTLKYNL